MKELTTNPFTCFDRDWAIVTAGSPEHFNGMTISWGSMGTIWGKPVVSVYVRPDRYTWRFLKENDYFTVSFYPEECRNALELMGTLSGRDGDKAAKAGLTPKPIGESMTFAEASRTILCKKIYMHPLELDAVPPEAKRIYRNGIRPHELIMGEVVEIVP